jgi:hypothetical protein
MWRAALVFVKPVQTVRRSRSATSGALSLRQCRLGVLALLATAATANAQLAPGQFQSALPAMNKAAPTQFQPPVQEPSNAFVRFFRDGEWYFSWGYNKEYWAPSNIHVSQPSLGNDFTIHGVRGQDELQQAGDIFTTDPFGPQYNWRIGRFIDDARTFGVELNFDHTKYTSLIGQTANVTGTIGGVPTNAAYQLSNQFFSEQLHNGANHLMVNAVYRYPLIGRVNESFSVAAIAKAGVGIMLPHTTDTILGNTNSVGSKTLSNAIGLANGWWQLNGVTTGAELGFRFVLWKPVYLELTDKVAYAYLGDLPAYLGTLQQSLWMNEIVLSIGFAYDGTAK